MDGIQPPKGAEATTAAPYRRCLGAREHTRITRIDVDRREVPITVRIFGIFDGVVLHRFFNLAVDAIGTSKPTYPKYSVTPSTLSSFIWSVADLLRGDYKQSLYGRIILPFTVLRRLDCVLAPTKEAVLKEKEKREAQNVNPEPFMIRKSGLRFVNTSRLDMNRLMGDVRAMKERFPELISIYQLERVLTRGLSAGITQLANDVPFDQYTNVELLI